jgi:hypothetical protein
MIVTGLVGPLLNPALVTLLDTAKRLTLVFGGALAHMMVRAILWSLEDR